MSKTIKILFCPVDGEPKFMDIQGELREYYKLIDCRCIDILDIDDDGLCMIIDDEGRFKDDAKVNPNMFLMIKEMFNYGICGNYILANTDESGDTVSLSAEQIEKLEEVIEFEKHPNVRQYIIAEMQEEKEYLENNPDALMPKVFSFEEYFGK